MLLPPYDPEISLRNPKHTYIREDDLIGASFVECVGFMIEYGFSADSEFSDPIDVFLN